MTTVLKEKKKGLNTFSQLQNINQMKHCTNIKAGLVYVHGTQCFPHHWFLKPRIPVM